MPQENKEVAEKWQWRHIHYNCKSYWQIPEIPPHNIAAVPIGAAKVENFVDHQFTSQIVVKPATINSGFQ